MADNAVYPLCVSETGDSVSMCVNCGCLCVYVCTCVCLCCVFVLTCVCTARVCSFACLKLNEWHTSHYENVRTLPELYIQLHNHMLCCNIFSNAICRLVRCVAAF